MTKGWRWSIQVAYTLDYKREGDFILPCEMGNLFLGGSHFGYMGPGNGDEDGLKLILNLYGKPFFFRKAKTPLLLALKFKTTKEDWFLRKWTHSTVSPIFGFSFIAKKKKKIAFSTQPTQESPGGKNCRKRPCKCQKALPPPTFALKGQANIAQGSFFPSPVSHMYARTEFDTSFYPREGHVLFSKKVSGFCQTF